MFIKEEKLAMLIIDMQNAFLHDEGHLVIGGEDPTKYRQIVPNVKALAKVAREHKIPVIYMRHAYLSGYVDGGILTHELFPSDMEVGGWLDGSFGAEIYGELAPEEGDIVMRKNRYSSFYGTHLDTVLKTMGVNSLIITGIHANCCCESTARDAVWRDYRVYFMSNGTATQDDELKKATLRNIDMNFGTVMTTEEMAKKIKKDCSK